MKRGMEKIGRGITPEAAVRKCLDKVRYGTKNSARDHATKIAKRSPEGGALRPYKCGLCTGWHLTRSFPFGLTKRPAKDRAKKAA